MKTKADDLIEKAGAKLTELSDVKSGNYVIIPGFSKYEFNGIIIRNVEKKNILSFKTGTKKYQLLKDDGTRPTLTKGDIKDLMPVKIQTITAVIKKQKTANKTNEAKSRVGNPPVSSDRLKFLNSNVFIKKIITENEYKHKIQYRLHLRGLTINEISAITGVPKPATHRNIWYYTSGKKVL